MTRVENLQIVYTICVILLLAPNLGRAANVKFTNLQCTIVDQTSGEFKICSLKAVRRDLVEMSIHYALFVEAIDDASLHLQFKKRGGNNDKRAMYQYKIDMCAFLRNTRRNPLAELFYTVFEFKKYSNINHSCPYSHDLIVKGCRLNTKLLGVLAISPGEYTIFTSWYLKEKLAVNIDVSIMVN